MDIHQMRVFASVYRHRSFSKASRELHLTQPTISNHIANLEAELGCRLFDRAGRRTIPTEEAKALYAGVQDIIDRVDNLKDAVGGLRGGVEGELVIGASSIPATYILPAIAAAFRAKHPGASFHIRVGDTAGITDLVVNHELLLGVVGAKMEHGRLDYQPFIEDELLLIAPPGLKLKPKVELAEAIKHPFLLRETGSGTRRIMLEYMARQGTAPKDLNVAAVLGSTDAVKQAVKSGLGVSIVSKFAVADEIADAKLTASCIAGMKMVRPFYAITHKRRSLARRYAEFLEYMLKGQKT